MNEVLDTNAVVSYDSTGDCVRWGESYTPIDWDYWRIYPCIGEWYPYSYPVYINTLWYEDTYKKAFNIAKLLLKKDFLISRKLKDFIGLVEEIAKEL